MSTNPLGIRQIQIFCTCLDETVKSPHIYLLREGDGSALYQRGGYVGGDNLVLMSSRGMVDTACVRNLRVNATAVEC